ncbi:CCA tRNA nucleotidyltransferase [Aestuariibius sp. 2305UL40-4]|uniref:CCA tRNA nucleotidyltransferase n=1 Tax=Aestuariibius violaceus TaxID=3234132 RepID=UPI00345E89A1
MSQNITADWLTDPRAQRVCAALTSRGHQAYFVGGCVRNTLIGAPVADLDIATNAHPDEVTEAAEADGLKAVPTGIDHGTVTIITDGLPVEITTFRQDVATDGRRATVAFGTSLTEDARRRDFTMNALYADPEGNIVDPLGGLPDLKARILRFIEDPATRIKEDALRILRFFRFHAWYGDPAAGLDPDGYAACAELAPLTDTLSQERITAELLKLLAAPDPAPSLAAMAQAGLLTRLLPGADTTAMPVLIAAEETHGLPPAPLRRLALIGGDTARLRLSRKEAAQLAQTRTALNDDPNETAYRHGADIARDAHLVHAALTGAPPDPQTLAKLPEAAAQIFPVKAADLPNLQGPALGQRLKQLEADWIASGFTLTKAELLSDP